jgi:diacylglycerol diphosphate phosphatase/phosphatidate phosphatase
LGTICAYFAYRQYYPGLSQDACRDPFLTRVAYCKKGYDLENGIIVVQQESSSLGGNAIGGAQYIAAGGNPQKYQLDDVYSDEDNGNSSSNNLEHSNSRVPLVGRQ